MKTILAATTLAAATLLPVAAVAQQKAVAQGGEALVNASSAGVVRSMSGQYTSLKPVPAKALLTDYLSSHWTKAGDPVKARLTGSIQLTDGTVLSRGTVLLGHVDHVDVSTHGSNGTIALTFDQAKTKTGSLLPIKATIVRVADAFDPANPTFSVELNPNMTLPSTTNVLVTPLNKGAVGLKSSQAAPGSGTVICNGENLTLSDGTQFLLTLVAGPNAQVAEASK